MDIEPIFDFNINQIESKKLNNIRIMPTSINFENYTKLSEILRNNTQIENVFVHCTDENDRFWNNFFRIFKSESGQFSIDPSKIVLSGEIGKINCNIFEDIRRLSLLPKDIGNISAIEQKFPNLESILPINYVEPNDIGDNLINLINIAKYTKFIRLNEDVGVEEIRAFIKKCGLEEKLFLSDDGLCLINKDRLADISPVPEVLKINIRDIDRIGIENIKKSREQIVLIARNAAELPIDKISEYEELGLDVSGVQIVSDENDIEQNSLYDIKTYSAIREKLEELVEGISPALTEKERFAEVYKRVCENIIYDTPAAYPKGKEEEKYRKEQSVNCRNLKNGLLEGKCVCAGYADILRNALSLVGIEAKYITGPVIEKEIKKRNFKPEKLDSGYVYKEDDKKVVIAESHAWNKVKLDGVWYNVDATWDAPRVRNGALPTNCLKSDEYIQEKSKKDEPKGPKCEYTASDEEIRNLFGAGNKYIGNFKIPSVKDIIKRTKRITQDTKNSVKRFKDRILKNIKKNPQLEPPDGLEQDEDTKVNPWAIENWGEDRNEVLSKSKDIASGISNKEHSIENSHKDDATR